MTRPIGWMWSTDKGVRTRRVVVCATLGTAAVLLLAATSRETTAAAPRASAVSLVQLASTQQLEAREEANQQMATEVIFPSSSRCPFSCLLSSSAAAGRDDRGEEREGVWSCVSGLADASRRKQVDKEADESEFWSDGKVRKVLGRMLRCGAQR